MPRGGLSFVDVRDAALGVCCQSSAGKGKPGERHLLGKAVNWDFDEFFARLSRISGVAGPMLRLPSQVKIAGGHLLEKWARAREQEPELPAADVEMGECWFFIDPSKAERVLGFRARDPIETLSETVLFVRERFLAGHHA